MSRLRPFREGDEPSLAEICLRTADAGADATGVLRDDDLWAEIFVLPYVARHPDLAVVAETDDGRAAGYVVGADDTDAFEEWFRSGWWPRFSRRWPEPGDERSRQADLLRYAYRRGPGREEHAARYPAHLHIDLLPELQGQGIGRRLIAHYVQVLRERGVPGVHLVATAENTGALAFYPRVGFTPLPSPAGVQAFGMLLD